eukprot:gb/GECH01012869.1/.p1 GENE.gb/GECH01012869.1/~~gb/GECH01012869.1/.p1  ORF type:complete len:530 (+),score=104.32 gb/GECH01012869.1/:1-1590(+)
MLKATRNIQRPHVRNSASVNSLSRISTSNSSILTTLKGKRNVSAFASYSSVASNSRSFSSRANNFSLVNPTSLRSHFINNNNPTQSILSGTHGSNVTTTRRAFVHQKADSTQHTSLVITVGHEVGALKSALDILTKNKINMTRIESRPSKVNGQFDIHVDLEEKEPERTALDSLVSELRSKVLSVDVRDSGSETPWFPRKISDLDYFNQKTLEYGDELDSNHPGFSDKEYRDRRAMITENAKQYRHGLEIPRVDYTETEKKTWGEVYRKLTSLYPTHAVKEVNYAFPLLEANCGYSPDNIPQLQDVSDFLQDCTGFRLRPVTGLLSSRDFLNGLAFRVFHSTQYIRHHSKPLYTPEPDVCHELLGHAPLLADPDFADFSQQIGLASLGASDEEIERLGTVYWFTIEFGVCRQDNEVKAYGAGLLSSFGELEHCRSDKPEIREFDPHRAAVTEYPITTYQPTYYLARSFQDMKTKMIDFTSTLDRPFAVKYNPYTQSVDVLNTQQSVKYFASNLADQQRVLSEAISKLHN